jgi:hypothetical protein
MYKLFKATTFDPWDNMDKPCPSNKPVTVTITDKPQTTPLIGNWTLNFEIKVKSSCSSCTHDSLSAKATQELVHTTGRPSGIKTQNLTPIP